MKLFRFGTDLGLGFGFG
ncbi:unnamed protein product, partial [Rotaria sp. Silwood2]